MFLFGTVPIVLSSETSVDERPQRPSEAEFLEFLEGEFIAVSEVLNQTPGKQSAIAIGIIRVTTFRYSRKELGRKDSSKTGSNINSHGF